MRQLGQVFFSEHLTATPPGSPPEVSLQFARLGP